jgi:hypothetical protein
MPVPFDNPASEHIRVGWAFCLSTKGLSTQPRLNRCIQKFKSYLLIALYLAATTFCHAEISGEISFAGEHRAQVQKESQSGLQTKQITVTSLGASPEGAEKQAITDAVRQAVGTYIDANTLVQNEEVVRDRILSVSNGFVKEYKPTAPARKRDDGLYEITIIATIESNQVVQALKEMNLISSEIAGQNLWAEASTKLKNSNDSLEFLNEKLPDFIKSLIKLDLIDESGKITKSINPVIQTQNGDQVTATWFVKLSVDQKTYFKSFAPILVKCMQNITGSKGEKFQIQKPSKDYYSDGQPGSKAEFFAWDRDSDSKMEFKIPFFQYDDDKFILYKRAIFIVEKATINRDFMKGTTFRDNEYHSILKFTTDPKWGISVDLLSNSGEILAKGSKAIRAPFSLVNLDPHNNYRPEGALSQVGPFIYTESQAYKLVGIDPVFQVDVHIPIDAMKDVKKIECQIEIPSDLKLEVHPAKKS